MERRGILRELLASGPGRAGVGLFALLAVVSLYVVATYPADYGSSRWSNPAVWADNPKSAPPAWSDPLHRHPWRASHRPRVRLPRPDALYRGGPGTAAPAAFHLPGRRAAHVPLFLRGRRDLPRAAARGAAPVGPSRRRRGRSHAAGDGRPSRRGDSALPATRHRTVAGRRERRARGGRGGDQLLEREYGITVARERLADQLMAALFGRPGPDGRLEILEGDYRFEVRVTTYDRADSVGFVRTVAAGSEFGAMGTDAWDGTWPRASSSACPWRWSSGWPPPCSPRLSEQRWGW